jgi:hypothetical protein
MVVSIWKPIPGVPNRYEASDEGQIRTIDYETVATSRTGNLITRQMKGRILKPRINKHSPSLGIHPVVKIYRSGDRHSDRRVARLVCGAFYGVPYDVTDQRQVSRWKVRCLDGDVTNTHALNLAWVYSAGSDGSLGKNQAAYEKNLDGYAESAKDVGSIMSRLFAEDAA